MLYTSPHTVPSAALWAAAVLIVKSGCMLNLSVTPPALDSLTGADSFVPTIAPAPARSRLMSISEGLSLRVTVISGRSSAS